MTFRVQLVQKLLKCPQSSFVRRTKKPRIWEFTTKASRFFLCCLRMRTCSRSFSSSSSCSNCRICSSKTISASSLSIPEQTQLRQERVNHKEMKFHTLKRLVVRERWIIAKQLSCMSPRRLVRYLRHAVQYVRQSLDVALSHILRFFLK